MRLALAMVGIIAAVTSSSALNWSQPAGSARASPVVEDTAGRRLATGELHQWLDGGALHVTVSYVFGNGHDVEERAVFQQQPQLAQQSWSWRERRNGETVRQFDVAFSSGRAAAMVMTDGKAHRVQETLSVPNGDTFAGSGFTFALAALRQRLLDGETVSLHAVAFTPKPRVVSVAVSYAGRDSIHLPTRTVAAERFVLHPKVPAIASLFVKVPDDAIWLTPPPSSFVRFEGPLVEPDDPIVRINAE